jgi:hypothetical protein
MMGSREITEKNVLTVGRVDWPSAVIAPQWLTTTTTRSDCLYANALPTAAAAAATPNYNVGLSLLLLPLGWMCRLTVCRDQPIS